MVISLVGLIIFILDILAIMDCLKSSMDSGKKILWIILILILPLVGLILYHLIGKQK